uniref:C-type lectin domain-containing protein n=1 Tax=Pygocentrus nattereri TaxID=42514 RepID=A0A3B4C4T2_PYGNA
TAYAIVALLFFSFLLVILMITLRAAASIPTNPPSNLEQVLEHGWTYFNYSLYHLSKEREPWTEARVACQHKNAELVIINSIEEQEFIQSLLTKSSSAWVGLTTMYSKWQWVDGTPETGISSTNDPPLSQCKNILKSEMRLMTEQCSNPHLWIFKLWAKYIVCTFH